MQLNDLKNSILSKLNENNGELTYNGIRVGMPAGGYPGASLTVKLNGDPYWINNTTQGIWSIRKVFSGYTGNSLRLRRSSDSAESDFGFVNGMLDTTSIQTWAGSDTLYVTKVYNQIGGPDLAQSNTNSQPIFVINRTQTNNFSSWEISSTRKLGLTLSPNGISYGIMGGVIAPIGSQSSGGYNVAAACLYWAQSAGWGTLCISILDDEIAWRWGTGYSATNTKARTASNALVAACTQKIASIERAFVNGTQLGTDNTGRSYPTANNSSTLSVGGGADGDEFANAYVCELIFYPLTDINGDTYTANAATAFNI